MIDAWSGPTPSPQEFPRNEPDGIRKLLDKIRAVELSVREVTSNLLGSAGIRLTRLGMFIDSSLTVGGTQTVNGPLAVHGTAAFDGATTIGGTLGVTGPTTLAAPTTVSGSLGVSGPMTVSGTLSLPAGIIDNAALASPVKPIAVHADNGVTNFAVTTTRATQASVTVTVPTGFTQALIFVVGQASAVNSTAVVDTLFVSEAVNGVIPTGWAATQDVAPGGLGGATTAAVKLLTGLTGGGTFTLATQIYSAYAGWAGSASNSCNVDATVIFLR